MVEIEPTEAIKKKPKLTAPGEIEYAYPEPWVGKPKLHRKRSCADGAIRWTRSSWTRSPYQSLNRLRYSSSNTVRPMLKRPP
jgi:hypothetical protein